MEDANMTTRWFGALLITATALTPVAAPVFAANAATIGVVVREDVAVRDGADRAVRPVQTRVMTQAAPATTNAPNFQDRRDGGGRHGGGNGGGGGWGGGNRGPSTTATPAPAPAPRADRSGGGQWQGRSAERGGYTRPAPTVDSNAGSNVQYQRRGYDRPTANPAPNAGADIQYQRRGGDAGVQRGDQGRTRGYDRGGYDRGGYNRGGDQNRGGGVVVTQPAPRYDRQRNDGQRYDNRGYDNRGRDDRRYDNRGNDNRRYDNRGYDNRRYDNGRYGNGRNNGYASWNQGWRNDRRYDWVNYRARYGSQFSLGRYYVPYRNWNYRRLTIGFSLWPLFYSDRYWINDPWSYRLPDVYGPYRWVRYYDDAILVDVETGEVVDTIYDFFW
jgi:hypothetical protein